MKSYTNKTRFSAIITLSVDSTDNPQSALELGANEIFEKHFATVGHYDIVVEPGQEIRAGNNTVITFLGARTAP